MVTLKDIADCAGVSMMTVSRVMNNKGKVSEKTAAQIRAIADEMGYIPNSSARSLAAHSSKIIAVIMRDSEDGNPLAESYAPTFLGLITKEIQRRGYYVMIHFVESFSDITFRLRSWNAEGAIIIGLFDDEVKKIQSSNHIPLVFIDSYSDVRQIINIGIDDYKGGVLAAETFVKNGHSRVGFYGPLDKKGGVVSKRLQGFCDTLKSKGISLKDTDVFDSTVMSASDVIDSICKNGDISGIFAHSDDLAVALYTAALRKGIDVPKALSLIGFDDMPICKALPMPLTTIRQDINQKALTTCQVLFDHLDDQSRPSESLILDVDLVSRDSVCTKSN